MNVGGDLAKFVPGRVSTEVDARLAYDTHSIVQKVLLPSNLQLNYFFPPFVSFYIVNNCKLLPDNINHNVHVPLFEVYIYFSY